MKSVRHLAAVSSAAVLAAASAPAFAQATGTGPDYSALTGAIDFTSTTTAILSVGALAIGVTLAVMGVRKVIGLVRGS